MVARFGAKSGWDTKEVRMRPECGIWNFIYKVKEVFWNFIAYKLGSGREIRFWEDRWVGEVLFKESFRTFYSLDVEHKVLVVDLYDDSSKIWVPRLR